MSHSAWPRVLGISSIIMASMGICLWTGLSIFSFLEQFGVIESGPDDPPGSLFALGTYLASLVMSAWLLEGGIGLIRTRCNAPRKLKAWAVARIVVLVAWLVATYLDWQVLVELERSKLNPLMVDAPRAYLDYQGFAVAGSFALIIFAIWLLLWPLVLLVYLNLKSIRREVEGWSLAQASVDSGDQS